MHSRKHSYCLVLMCSLFDFIRRRHDYKSWFLCRLTSWRESWLCSLVLMGRVSVTIHIHPVVWQPEKQKNIPIKTVLIENLAPTKYSMWHREANKCNNKCTFCMFRRRAALSCKNVNRLCNYLIAQCKEREVIGTWHFYVLFYHV